ncbi:MAG: glycosyl hydrolase [Calditrichaeota bacterium]|nr:glycosyl hydrolase [Calditrichota bacterium]
MSGRVVDIEPHPTEPYTFFVAYATGGLWRTSSNGQRFEPLFENQNAISIGDIAVDPRNPDIIWVGTGEKNSSRSSYSGTGIYKTIDGGKSWAFMGLADIHHTGRIVIHPQNSDIVYVAALGHLYTENEERGVYRTKDGGKTWEKILYVSPRTGFVDLVISPKDPNIIFAAAWEKDRKAWNFVEGGNESGIYKSTDGGDNWTRLSGGFPQGKFVGRIGLAVYPENPDIVYAIMDNQKIRPKKDQKETAAISAKKLLHMKKKDLLALSDNEFEGFLRRYGFQKKYSAEIVREMIVNDELTKDDLLEFIRKNNPHAFDPQIIGAEIYRSDDGGASWRKMNEDYINSFYSTYGYYFGEIRVAPHDPNRIYILGIPLLTSADGGKSIEWVSGKGVHGDHHAFWIDPNFPNHLIDGNDGGLNISYDGGKSWWKLNYVPVGQFYSVNVDMAEPYNIYGGLQDNGVYKGSSKSVPLKTSPWKAIYGGDGMQVQIDPKDFTVYTGFQFGNYARINQKTKKRTSITPMPDIKDPGLRYNWQTPIWLSAHCSNVLYFGANRLYRSLDRGDTWQAISPDLTTNPKEIGDVPYATITSIMESPITFGLIYVGTDDGRIHVTRDGGYTWKEIGKSLPQGLWCSRVIASYYDEGTAYVTLNGYRDDDFRAYVFRTRDFGENWKSIKSNMPDEALNVIREDPYNPHVLYVGSDKGVFVSINDGKSWDVLQTGIPIVPAHDMVIHPRDHELVVGTHGRSIYVINVKPIQELTPVVMKKVVHLFEPKEIREEARWKRAPSFWARPSEPTLLDIHYWLNQSDDVKILVKNKKGQVLRTLKDKGIRGINTLKWDLTIDRNIAFANEVAAAQKELKSLAKKLAKAKKENKKITEIQTLEGKITRAKEKIRQITEKISKLKKYGKLAEKKLRKKVAPAYLSKGNFTIEVHAGKFSDSKTLKVLPLRERKSKTDPDVKRKWEMEKRRKKIKKEYSK